MTGSNQTKNVADQLKPDSNRTRPAQIGFDRLKPDKDQTGSNQNQTGPDRLKSVLNSSNQNIPAQPNQPRPERLKPDQTGPDRLLERLKPVFICSIRISMAETGFDQLKSDQTSSNQTQTGPEWIKPVLTGSTLTQTGPDRLKPVLTSSNQTHTGPDRLKPVLNGSNQTIPAQRNQTGPDRLKRD